MRGQRLKSYQYMTGVSDIIENCVYVLNYSQDDMDGDRIGDACDNCPLSSNREQVSKVTLFEND